MEVSRKKRKRKEEETAGREEVQLEEKDMVAARAAQVCWQVALKHHSAPASNQVQRVLKTKNFNFDFDNFLMNFDFEEKFSVGGACRQLKQGESPLATAPSTGHQVEEEVQQEGDEEEVDNFKLTKVKNAGVAAGNFTKLSPGRQRYELRRTRSCHEVVRLRRLRLIF